MRVCPSGGLTFISPYGLARALLSVIARSEATKQSRLFLGFLDCFAEPVIARAFARPVGSQ
jgi:hypothetical protein